MWQNLHLGRQGPKRGAKGGHGGSRLDGSRFHVVCSITGCIYLMCLIAILGTTHYMAPEVMRGKGYGLEVDARPQDAPSTDWDHDLIPESGPAHA